MNRRLHVPVLALAVVLGVLATPAVAAAPTTAWQGTSSVFGVTINVYGYASSKIKVVATPTCDTTALRTTAIGRLSTTGRFSITAATTTSKAYKPIDVVVTGRVTKAKVTGSYRVRYQRTNAASSCSYGPDPFVAKRLARVPSR